MAHSLERISKVPNRTEDQLGITPSFFMDVTTATERFCIIDDLPDNIIACQRIHINIVLPDLAGSIVHINGVIRSYNKIRDIVSLLQRQHFRLMNGDIYTIPIVHWIWHIYLIVVLIVVNFQQPSSGNLIWVCGQFVLFGNLHPVLAYTDLLCQHIESDIVSIENDLHRLLRWSICHPNKPAQFKANGIAKVHQVIIHMG